MPRFSKLNGKQSRTSHSIKLCNLGNRGINITMIAINNSRLLDDLAWIWSSHSTLSVTHVWTRFDALHSPHMGQFKQMYSFQSCPAFRRYYSNITFINNSRLITLWYFLLITCVLFERKTVILMIVTSGIWLTQWGLEGRQLFALILHSAGPEIYAYTTIQTNVFISELSSI
jgi:hypothetical protein